MANGHGGYRQPEHPAPTSGPGRLARRTDGGPGQALRVPTGGSYGDAQAMDSIQRSAAMNLAPGALTPGAGSSVPPGPPVPVTPFGAPSSRPGEPVTSGASVGAGPGPESLGLPTPTQLLQQDAQSLAYAVSIWEHLSNLPGASPSTRAVVQRLKSMLSGT